MAVVLIVSDLFVDLENKLRQVSVEPLTETPGEKTLLELMVKKVKILAERSNR